MDAGDAWWYGAGGNNWDLDAVVRFGCGGGGHVTPPPPPALQLGCEEEYDAFSSSSSILVPPMTQQPPPPLPVWGDDDAWMAPLAGLHTGCWPDPAHADPVAADDLSGALFAASAPAPAPQLLAPPQAQQPAVAEATTPTPVDNPQPATNQQASGGRGGGSRSAARRKKKQVAKEVVRVAAQGPAADEWAWRKYGQKPIKGSPYPRGYYRCSSDKSCSARKQVERCRLDPSFLLLTYTGSHSGHDVPLHHNSLAGTTRHKHPPFAAAAATDGTTTTTTTKKKAPAAESTAASSSHSHQSTSPLLTSSSVEMNHGGGDEDYCDVVDMAIDGVGDEEEEEATHAVQWRTPISDAVIGASCEWR